MKDVIKKYFKEAIQLNMTIDSEFKAALLRHDRTNKYFDNMSYELSLAQQRLLSKGKILKIHTIKGVVYDMTDVFIQSVKMESEQRSESILNRLAKEAKAQKITDMESTVKGKPAGDYIELVQPSGETDGRREESKT